MYDRPIVPKDFIVPQFLKTSEFILKPLTIGYLIKDFDAVMSSVEHLSGLMDPNDRWPIGLTIEENLVDLGWHQREFTLRHSFAYTVLSLNEEECLGCCYIYPASKLDYDVQVFYWIRKEYLATGLEDRLGVKLLSWLEKDWPFTKIILPGRE